MKKIIPIATIFFLLFIHIAIADYPANTQINFILILEDQRGNPIPNATCIGYVWNSDMTTINQTLPLSYNSFSKVYHSNFTTFDTAGQYLQTSECTLLSGSKAYDRKIFVVSGAFPDLTNSLVSINNTIKSEHNTTNNLIDYWGNSNNVTTNYWGNSLETKLDNLILGNVTLNVSATVDYDKIATYTLIYFKGAKFWCWFIKCK